jgi:hypothetical protein
MKNEEYVLHYLGSNAAANLGSVKPFVMGEEPTILIPAALGV